MIRAIIELELVRPYQRSFDTLLEFCNIWRCKIRRGGTYKSKARISMPSAMFKQIFGVNPRTREYKVPRKTEKFLESVKVTKVTSD